MRTNVDLTENRMFTAPFGSTFNLRGVVIHMEELKDTGAIAQGSGYERLSKKLCEQADSNEICIACGRPIHPYEHNDLCKKCDEHITDNSFKNIIGETI